MTSRFSSTTATASFICSSTLWKNFGEVIKEGLSLDYEFREKLSALVRLTTRRGPRP
jgi:HSP90 family molecular chaperone